MRRRARPLAAALAVVAAVVAACGVPTDDQPRAISQEQAPDLDEGEEGTTAAVTETATLFLTRGDGAVRYLAPLEEQVPVGPSAIDASPTTALETLLSYTPSETLQTQGYASRIPPDTALASTPELDEDGVLVVDLNSNIDNVRGDGSRLGLRADRVHRRRLRRGAGRALRGRGPAPAGTQGRRRVQRRPAGLHVVRQPVPRRERLTARVR